MSTIETGKCVHCSEPITGKYCANCGKKASSERINLRFLLSKLLHSADLDAGFVASIKYLLTNPGKAIREYVTGEKVGLSNPMKLFVIIGAVTTWLTFQFQIFELYPETNMTLPFLDWETSLGYAKYSTKYFSFFTLTAIPIFSLVSWLFFVKSGFNYLENLVLNIYVAVGQFILLLIFIPFMIQVRELWIMQLYGFVNLSYNLWALLYFFKAFRPKSVFIVVLAVVLPYALAYFSNYLLYSLAPDTFWSYLDRVLG